MIKPSPRGRMPDGTPNPIDIHVGNRLRLRRVTVGMTQDALGKALGLTFQQVQKYERGYNRIGCSRIWDLATVLHCDVQYFFEDLPRAAVALSPRNLNDESVAAPVVGEDISREFVWVWKGFGRLGPAGRAAVKSLISALSTEAA